MDLTIRPVTEQDAATVADLLNLTASEPITAERMRQRLRDQTAQFRARMVAIDATGHIVGYGQTVRNEWLAPGVFWVHIVVVPELRRQGIGSYLYSAISEMLVAQGATTLMGEAREAFPEALAFALHHGFHVERHIFESTLPLADFDESRFSTALDTAQAAGVHFFTLADVGDTLDARRALHTLEQTVARDIPGGSETSTRPFDAYLRDVCAAPSYRAECQFVAAVGPTDAAHWVGLASLEYLVNANAMYNGTTGVLPAYRGRGIALALKLLSIRTARRYGVDYIRTNNDALNAPMLAINRKLGYQPQPGYYRLRADVV